MTALLNFILGAFPLGMTFLFGCAGEILTEKSGHLNLGVPGVMCIGGACGSIALSLMHDTGLPAFLIVIIAILASFAGGILMGALYSFLTVTLHSNQNVTGLAMTIFGGGMAKFVMDKLMLNPTTYTYAFDYFRFPFATSHAPYKTLGVMVWLAIAIAVVMAIVLNKTRVGLHLRAVGENPATADAAGINVTAYKYVATCLGCGIAAIGGISHITVASGTNTGYQEIEMFGWVAVALVICALWKPVIGIIGSVLFSVLYNSGTYVSGLIKIGGVEMIPLFRMLPYLVTLIVLIITSVRKKRENQPPASLGNSYFREDR